MLVQARDHVQVLNAFRHHRGGHAAVPAAEDSRQVWCSTPFGITEVGIRWLCVPLLSVKLSAQRLSASQRWASQRRRRSIYTYLLVLNAFRHHRGGHVVVTVPRVAEQFGAQRLSASQRWASQVLRLPCHPVGSAQRLSASQRWASGDLDLEAQADEACSTPFGITEVGIAPFQTPSMKHLAQAVFKVGVGSQPKRGERGLAPLRPTAQFFQGTGVRENHGSSELPRSLKFNPRNLLSGFLGLGPPHSRGCLNCAKRRDRDLGRRHLPCATVRRCHTAPGRRASSGRSGRSGSFPCPPRIGRRGE